MADTLNGFDREYMRVLGDVIRGHRRKKGWTRKDLQQRLGTMPHGGVDISLQTLATYELGTRHCSVVRLAQIAAALGIRAAQIIAETDARVSADSTISDSTTIMIDLRRLADSPDETLAPAAAWANARLGASPHERRRRLSAAAVEQLANLCGLDLLTMFEALTDYRTATTLPNQ